MTSKARNLANLLADGAVGTSEIADGAVTSGKLGSGAAASNLGSYVTSVNGQTGAVTVSASPTTDQVLTATAGASVAAVGTYVLAGRVVNQNTTIANPGGTVAGSTLQYAQVPEVGSMSMINGTTLPGTWRCMGYLRNANVSFAYTASTLWLRIS
jgi:hypothetical protein